MHAKAFKQSIIHSKKKKTTHSIIKKRLPSLPTWRHPCTSCSRINIRWMRVSVSIVLVPRYKLSLCHTPIKHDLLGFLGIWGLCVWVAWLRVQKVHIIWYQSLASLIWLYSFISCIFVFTFRINFSVSSVFRVWYCFKSFSVRLSSSYVILD